eukprot:COSAG02_NODE_15584_length_1158_cov_1.239849_1_plen_230_part_10
MSRRSLFYGVMGQLLTREPPERPLVLLTGLLDGCDECSSKSSILHKASNGQVTEETMGIGMQYEVAELQANGIDLTIHCWDYGGADKIDQRRAQVERAAAVILVVSLSELDPDYRAFYHRKQDVPLFNVHGDTAWPVYAHQILPYMFQQAGCRKPVLVLVRVNPEVVGVDTGTQSPPTRTNLNEVVAGLHLGPDWDGGTRDSETSGSLGPGAPWRVQTIKPETNEGFQEG